MAVTPLQTKTDINLSFTFIVTITYHPVSTITHRITTITTNTTTTTGLTIMSPPPPTMIVIFTVTMTHHHYFISTIITTVMITLTVTTETIFPIAVNLSVSSFIIIAVDVTTTTVFQNQFLAVVSKAEVTK